MGRAKKFGIKASLAAVALTAPSTAFGWDIDRLISTDNTSLLLSADKGSTLRFSYYGPKIEQSDINPVHDTWAGANRAAYPAFGDITNRLTSFQMTHADGNITTFLQVDSVYSESTGKGEATVFILKDKPCHSQAPLPPRKGFRHNRNVGHRYKQREKGCDHTTDRFRIPPDKARRRMGHPSARCMDSRKTDG